MSRSTKKNVRLTRATVPHSMNGIQNPLCLCGGLVCVLAFQLFNYRRFTCSIDSRPVHPSVRLFHTQRIRYAALRSSGNQPVLISRLCARHLYTNSKRATVFNFFPPLWTGGNKSNIVEMKKPVEWSADCGVWRLRTFCYTLHAPLIFESLLCFFSTFQGGASLFQFSFCSTPCLRIRWVLGH